MESSSTAMIGRWFSAAFIYCIITALSGCHLLTGPSTNTVAEGFIVNKYTRQPLANVPIEVIQWRYGAFGNTHIDSVAGTFSGPDGHFSIAFDGNAKGVTYRIDFRNSRELFDLTDYRLFDAYSALDGASLTVGKPNRVDFEATPFVPVRIVVDADKQGSAALAVDAYASYLAGQSYFHAFTFVDTARTSNRTKADRVAYFVPNWHYNLSVWRSSLPPISSNSYGTSVSFTRFVGYNDTTIIRVH
ncbi:hypothetical protein KB206_19815 [Microvirga sp. STS02]|uniref:hypothetical protein n=1 Tax=Hymenobacter negativus TaxID=2795026 RepID=UPI0018DBE30A|nr:MULTISPECIES: hypothetical protein [Bacteria]MBH8571152.1 hypothetical protein [Hymenobacter negativus]MBR7210889.1 hypothetical protein [Microvirga sp. STS02]